MSYKTGGLKAKFTPPVYSGGRSKTYTVYAALESCSDMMCYAIVDDDTGEKTDLSFGTEDDCAHGSESLIDVMYTIKHNNAGVYPFGDYDSVVVEEMTKEEIDMIFRS